MSMARRVSRIILLIHGLFNVVQGLISALRPDIFIQKAPAGFAGSTDKAIQSIALGCIGVGVYGMLGAATNDSRFYKVTLGLRLLFASIAYAQWGWEDSGDVITYELAVAVIAGVAGYC